MRRYQTHVLAAAIGMLMAQHRKELDQLRKDSIMTHDDIEGLEQAAQRLHQVASELPGIISELKTNDAGNLTKIVRKLEGML